MRDFQVQDTFPYGIQLTWQKEGERVTSTVFERGSHVPSAKMLTFYRTEPFDIEAAYTPESDLPSTADARIGGSVGLSRGEGRCVGGVEGSCLEGRVWRVAARLRRDCRLGLPCLISGCCERCCRGVHRLGVAPSRGPTCMAEAAATGQADGAGLPDAVGSASVPCHI